jgi:chemotaxis protein MotA
MFAIIGAAVVVVAIMGGYLMEHGNLMVLLQPAELLIILGAAVGTTLIANPLPVIQKLIRGITGVFTPSKYNAAFFTATLKMLYEIFVYARKNGLVKLETDIEEPEKSGVFTKYPEFLKDRHAVDFVCDSLRMSISGGVGHYDLDQMMELDMDVHHHEANVPVNALSTVADSLPGLGIVAAVLGVVITMGAIGGPPSEIGHSVAAALVGTFLGILMCYGFVGPLASHMAKLNDAEAHYYQVLRVALISYVRGSAPILAVEFARRAIPSNVRPSFKVTEAACRGSRGGAAPAEVSAAPPAEAA